MDRDRRDRGFTLPEVLIVIAVTGILAVAIATVFSVIVRTAPPTEARTDDARTLLGLTTWLPPDVSSTPRIPVANADTDGAAFDTRDVASGCSESPGVNKLRLTWIEEHVATRTYTASYRLTDDGTGSRLVRVACTNGGSASVVNLTSTLPPASTNPVDVDLRDDAGWIVGVTMLVTTVDGDVLHVDAASPFPVETLPPLSSVVLDPTTSATLETTPPVEGTTPTAPPDPSSPTTEATTTTTSTTTLPPCTASFDGDAPDPVANANNATSNGNNEVTSGPLGEPVTIIVSKGPNCGNLGLEYEHSPGSFGWTSLSGTSQLELPRDNLVAWDDGDRPLRLRDGQGGPVLDTRMLTIT